MENVELVVRRNVFGSFAALVGDRIVAEEYAREGCWERAVVEFLRERCFPDGIGTYVDAGAHIGLTAIPVALRHPKVNCYAFEPEATNFCLLEMNKQGNNTADLMIVQKALSDVTGPAKMLRDTTRSIDHRMLCGRSALPGIENEDQRPIFPVEAVRLDTILQAPVRPLVLKIDVQGHEAKVLRGAMSLSPEVIVMEYWPYALSREDETVEAILALLSSFEYGTILIEAGMLLRRNLLGELLQTIPWNGKATTAIELVAAKKELK